MSMPAHAVELDGTFAGTVRLAQFLPHTHFAPHPASYYEGATVTGTFAIQVVDPQREYMEDGFAAYREYFGALSLSYTLKGVNYGLDKVPGATTFLALGSSTPDYPYQQLYVETVGGSFGLIGPPGSLFSGLDPTTLHFDPAVAYTGHNSLFSDLAQMTFYVDITKVNFKMASAVPEPSTGALLLVGGALLVGWSRLRR